MKPRRDSTCCSLNPVGGDLEGGMNASVSWLLGESGPC